MSRETDIEVVLSHIDSDAKVQATPEDDGFRINATDLTYTRSIWGPAGRYGCLRARWLVPVAPARSRQA